MGNGTRKLYILLVLFFLVLNGTEIGGGSIRIHRQDTQERVFRALGINLDAEFEEIYQEIPITTAHQKRWHKHTRRLSEICKEMGLDPQPIPKMGDYDHCLGCGRCVFGCPEGVKWDSRRFLEKAREKGARVIYRLQSRTSGDRRRKSGGGMGKARLGTPILPRRAGDFGRRRAGHAGDPAKLRHPL